MSTSDASKFTVISCSAPTEYERFDFSIVSNDDPNITYSFFDVEINQSEATMNVIVFRNVFVDGVIEKRQIDIDDLEFEKWMDKAEMVFSEFFNYNIKELIK
jgi:hypothetical protein